MVLSRILHMSNRGLLSSVHDGHGFTFLGSSFGFPSRDIIRTPIVWRWSNDVVGQLVEGHSIAGSQGDQGTQLVAGLGYCPTAELGGCTIRDIEAGGDVYASEA